MDKLGGLLKKMPVTAVLFIVGSIAIAGLPPLNGFISEFLIYCGILKGINSAGIAQITLMILTFAGMSLIGGISLLTFTKTFGTIFLGSPRQKTEHNPVEVSGMMLVPQYIIVVVMIFIAFFPGKVIHLLATIFAGNIFPLLALDVADLNWYIDIVRSISIASLIFVGVIVLVFALRWILIRKTETKYSSTWGCGYVAPNTRMQYTGKSFSKSFGKVLNFILIEKKGYSEIEKDETFPSSRKYRSFYLDIIENKLIAPMLSLITRFMDIFQFIQNGKIQAYIIYGIVFIIVILLGTVLNFWH
jgi:NADH:ubiquinone oxidoreductase subunit 5 (subunit L)/multisubunit Na+/H+ antiporter MnhA subunit